MMAIYLAVKEVWRSRGRYILFSLVIALITVLVLFIAALAGGLANANKQFIDKLDADLLVYQSNVDLQPTASQLGQSKVNDIQRVDGVVDVGPLGFSTATMVFADSRPPVDVSLVGVDPGKPGDPFLITGVGLRAKRNNEVVIGQDIASQAHIQIGETVIIKTIQETEEEFYELRVVGITDARQYFFLPSVILPLTTWSKVRPKGDSGNAQSEIVVNMLAVKILPNSDRNIIARKIAEEIEGVEVADKTMAILALPGYTAQQSTLNTQQVFTMLIGVLVVGGFFQIQTLQKVAQIGVLKAIGSPSGTVALTILFQIILVTFVGVGIGIIGTLLLAFGMPANIPIAFTGSTVIFATALLLMIGPVGGLVSIRLALKIDPLMAIGLSA